MEEIAEQQTLFMQQDEKYMVIFIFATLKRNWEKDSTNTDAMPKSDQIIMYSQPTHTQKHDFNKDIEVLILKGNLHQKHGRELWEDKFIYLLGTKAIMGLNIEVKHYEREFYEAFTDLTL